MPQRSDLFLVDFNPKRVVSHLVSGGDLPKSQVRELAAEFGLPTAAKKDSQGLCFLGKIDLKNFLGHYFKVEQGNVIDDETGEIVGTHDGAWFYTVGERHGFKTVAETPAENLII